jgi:hypothetical protein
MVMICFFIIRLLSKVALSTPPNMDEFYYRQLLTMVISKRLLFLKYLICIDAIEVDYLAIVGTVRVLASRQCDDAISLKEFWFSRRMADRRARSNA